MDSDIEYVVSGTKSIPLLTGKQLLNWRDYVGKEKKYSVFKKAKIMSTKKKEHELLLCHDMKGGYLEDSFNDGNPNTESYRFYNWSLVDIFVYFSHNLVTIPPIGWINASHRNGVSCFGTFLVEDWSQIQTDDGDKPISGRNIILEMLKDSKTIKLYADSLVEIAQHYHFDGWLVNIEVNIPYDKSSALIEFVQILTDGMHRMLNNNDDAAVIWYDSVVIAGSIEYQNALTVKNYTFFDACDGIFLNYWWQPELLKRSVDLMNDVCDKKNRFRIYAGIDVHGRNTFGGGKLSTNLALRAIQEQQVSTALFAPAWTHENFCNASDFCFEEVEHKFWSKLYPFLIKSERIITGLPIKSSFCTGIGISVDSCPDSRNPLEPWFNLSEMELQPSFCLDRKISTRKRYKGNTTLEFDPKTVEEMILFRTDIKLSTKHRYELKLIYEYNNCLTRFLQFNYKLFEDFRPEIKVVSSQTEYHQPMDWKIETIVFEFVSKKIEFVKLEDISIRLSQESGVCYIAHFQFQQISMD